MFEDMVREAQIKVSPAFSKAAGFQRAAPFGRARRRETPLAAPQGIENPMESPRREFTEKRQFRCGLTRFCREAGKQPSDSHD